MTPPFALRQLDHAVLRVRSLPRALDFYCNVPGCTEERRVAQLGLLIRELIPQVAARNAG